MRTLLPFNSRAHEGASFQLLESGHFLWEVIHHEGFVMDTPEKRENRNHIQGRHLHQKPTRDLLQTTAFKGSLAALRDGDMCN